MDSMLQEQVDTLGDIYKNLTSTVLEYGYEYMREHPENSEIIKSIDETLKVFDLLESMIVIEDEDAPNQYESLPVKPSSQYQRINNSTVDAFDRSLNSPKLPEIYVNAVDDNLWKLYKTFNEKRRFNKPSPAHLQIPKETRNARKARIRQILESSLKKKIQENITQRALSAAQDEDGQLDISFNVEDLNLEI